ncbi:unnamed protein product [Orchesella dallaii]|uniref:Uncharacterized protein n=1 Tax=Orchesella dallaii TaxID=48710 RepID=A0ABP1REW9_9HEXA
MKIFITLLLISQLNLSLQFVFDGSKLDLPSQQRETRYAKLHANRHLDMSGWLNGQVIKLGNISEGIMTAIIDSIKAMDRSESIKFPRIKVFDYVIDKDNIREILVYLDPDSRKQWVVNIEDLDLRHYAIVFRTGDLGFGFRKEDTFVVLRKGIQNEEQFHFIHLAYVRPKINGLGFEVEWDNFKPNDLLPIPIVYKEGPSNPLRDCTPRPCGLNEIIFGTCNIVKLGCKDIEEFPLSGHEKERVESLIYEKQPFIYDLAQILSRSEAYWEHLVEKGSVTVEKEGTTVREKRRIHMHSAKHRALYHNHKAPGSSKSNPVHKGHEIWNLAQASDNNSESNETYKESMHHHHFYILSNPEMEDSPPLIPGLESDEHTGQNLGEQAPQNKSGEVSIVKENASEHNKTVRRVRADENVDDPTPMQIGQNSGSGTLAPEAIAAETPGSEEHTMENSGSVANAKSIKEETLQNNMQKPEQNAEAGYPITVILFNSSRIGSSVNTSNHETNENKTYSDHFVENLRTNPPSKYTDRPFECIGCEPMGTFLSDYEEDIRISPVVYNALADIVYTLIKIEREPEEELLFSPEKPEILEHNSDIPFIGYGSCGVSLDILARPPLSEEFDDIIDFYAETLAINCGEWKRDCEMERATANLRKLLASKYHMLEILPDMSVRFDAGSQIPKYGILSPNEFDQMMSSLIFSSYTNVYRKDQLKLINVDPLVQLNFGQSHPMKFLMKVVLRVVNHLISDLPQHLIKGSRYLLQLLQDKFLTLLVEHFGIDGYDFQGKEEEIIKYKEKNAIDRLHVLALKDFIINGIMPVIRSGADDTRSAYSTYFLRNRNRLVNELLFYGVGNSTQLYVRGALSNYDEQNSNHEAEEEDTQQQLSSVSIPNEEI